MSEDRNAKFILLRFMVERAHEDKEHRSPLKLINV